LAGALLGDWKSEGQVTDSAFPLKTTGIEREMEIDLKQLRELMRSLQ
jgi:hypothetical protein